jgi:ACR3 family arsenite efflux pump ArsB
MLRFGEAALAIAPLLALALLWAILYRRVPSRRAVLLLVLAEAAIGGVVVWQGVADGLAPHQRYVPAHMRDGAVTEGHGG